MTTENAAHDGPAAYFVPGNYAIKCPRGCYLTADGLLLINIQIFLTAMLSAIALLAIVEFIPPFCIAFYFAYYIEDFPWIVVHGEVKARPEKEYFGVEREIIFCEIYKLQNIE